MSMLQEFYVYLADLFEGGEGQLDPATVKEGLEEGGYEDVTAYDVREAVNLMFEEGDVFAADQSSVLEAYTGGNQVDQSFNGSGIGVASTTGTASSGPATNVAPSSGGASGGTAPAAPPVYTAPPPPPPMDPAVGYSEMDAAVQQIVYVSNITNNTTTTNTTTINDNDTFEDNDVIIDASIDQNIIANGDVTQDFDTTYAEEGAVAIGGDATDANVINGDNDGVVAEGITDSNLVNGDNDGVVGDVTGSAVVGDGNETTSAVDSDGNMFGDGDGNAIGDDSVSGDGNATGTDSISGDGNAVGDGSAAGAGSTAVTVEGSNDGIVNGSGEVEGIVDSPDAVGGFGEGDVTVNNNSGNDSSDHSIDNSDHSIDNSDNSDHSDSSDHSDHSDSSDHSDHSDSSVHSIDATVDVELDVDVVDIDNRTIGHSDIDVTDLAVEPASGAESGELLPDGA